MQFDVLRVIGNIQCPPFGLFCRPHRLLQLIAKSIFRGLPFRLFFKQNSQGIWLRLFGNLRTPNTQHHH